MEVEENYDLSGSVSIEIEPNDPNYEEEPNPYQSLNDDTVLTLNNTIDNDFALNLDIMDEILTCCAETQRIISKTPGPHCLLRLLLKQLRAVAVIWVRSRDDLRLIANIQEANRESTSTDEETDSESGSSYAASDAADHHPLDH